MIDVRALEVIGYSSMFMAFCWEVAAVVKAVLKARVAPKGRKFASFNFNYFWHSVMFRDGWKSLHGVPNYPIATSCALFGLVVFFAMGVHHALTPMAAFGISAMGAYSLALGAHAYLYMHKEEYRSALYYQAFLITRR